MSYEDDLAARAEAAGFRSLGIVIPGITGPVAPKGRPKYGNVRTEYGGEKYDSKAEAKRAEILDQLKSAGNIIWWSRQPKFRLGCHENVYKADFLVYSPDGLWAEDVKGFETPKFKRDKALWLKYGPFPLWVINGAGIHVIEPARRPS